jgi:hypothetical protein
MTDGRPDQRDEEFVVFGGIIGAELAADRLPAQNQWRWSMVKERLFTVKELAFIAGYQGYGDGERAAKAAGYGAKCAKGMACELPRNSHVAEPVRYAALGSMGTSS